MRGDWQILLLSPTDALAPLNLQLLLEALLQLTPEGLAVEDAPR